MGIKEERLLQKKKWSLEDFKMKGQKLLNWYVAIED